MAKLIKKAFELDENTDYMAEYKKLVETVMQKKEIWPYMDELTFSKFAAKINDPNVRISREAKEYILEQTELGKVKLTNEQFKRLIVETSHDNFDAIKRIDSYTKKNTKAGKR